jgi:FG-GAP-like repeat
MGSHRKWLRGAGVVAAVAVAVAAVPGVASARPVSDERQAPTAALVGSSFVLADFSLAQGWRVERNPRFMADINNDRRADIVGFGDAGVFTALARGDGGFFPTRFVLPAAFDFNHGWGVNPAAVINPGYQAVASAPSHNPRFVVDITGDGNADIVGIGLDGVWTATARGDGTFNGAGLVLAAFGSRNRNFLSRFFTADANGDGLTDLFSISDRNVQVALSRGNGTFAPPVLATTVFSFSTYDFDSFQVADVTGDRRAEILTLQVNPGIQMVVALPLGDGTYSGPFLAGAQFPSGFPQPGVLLNSVADVTGDGRADLVGFGQISGSGTGTWTARSRGNGAFDPYRFAVGNFSEFEGWVSSRHLRLVADVNGDGAGDMVGFGNAGVHLGISNRDGTFGSFFAVANFGWDQGWQIALHPRFVTDITGDGHADIVGFGDAGVHTAVL